MGITVLKTAALAGLFSCILALAGAFSGVTVSSHAITAAEVRTEADLREFVEHAVDEYYAEFLLKQHCDLTTLDLGGAADLLPQYLPNFGINDLSPASIQTLSAETVKKLISLFNSPGIQSYFPGGLDIWEACDFPDSSSFREVFGSGDGNWRSGSIYIFVLDENKTMLFHGADQNLESGTLGNNAGGTDDVGDLIIDGVEKTPGGVFVDCYWDEPTTGRSWKRSYVVDPFEYLQLDPPSDSPGIIFGSGIYPTDNPPSECQIVEPPAGSSGGGCAIAAGSDSTSRGIAFNLLLTVSAFFLAISLKSRAMNR